MTVARAPPKIGELRETPLLLSVIVTFSSSILVAQIFLQVYVSDCELISIRDRYLLLVFTKLC